MENTSLDDHGQRLRRISRVSGVMKWVLAAFMGLVAVIGVLLLLALTIPEKLDLANDAMELGNSTRTFGEVPAPQRWAMAGFYEICIFTFFMTLYYMRRIFAGFQIKDFFSTQTLSAMISCGTWFLIFGVLDFLEEPVTSTLSTLDLSAGQREVSVEFEGGEFFFIIFGMMFLTLGWVMREAARIHEENQQFI